jgi:hypothetical protein
VYSIRRRHPNQLYGLLQKSEIGSIKRSRMNQSKFRRKWAKTGIEMVKSGILELHGYQFFHA